MMLVPKAAKVVWVQVGRSRAMSWVVQIKDAAGVILSQKFMGFRYK